MNENGADPATLLASHPANENRRVHGLYAARSTEFAERLAEPEPVVDEQVPSARPSGQLPRGLTADDLGRGWHGRNESSRSTRSPASVCR